MQLQQQAVLVPTGPAAVVLAPTQGFHQGSSSGSYSMQTAALTRI